MKERFHIQIRSMQLLDIQIFQRIQLSIVRSTPLVGADSDADTVDGMCCFDSRLTSRVDANMAFFTEIRSDNQAFGRYSIVSSALTDHNLDVGNFLQFS